MQQYIDLLKKVFKDGEIRSDRTGVGTKSIFGGQVEFDLIKSFPLVTIKKTLWRSSFIELLWFIRGEQNTKFLKDHGVPIWDDWADAQGNLGPVYGVQWRKFPGKIHQVALSSIYDAIADHKHPLNAVVSRENFIGFSEHRSDNGDTIYLYQAKIDQLRALIDGIKQNPNGRRHIVSAWNPGFISEMGLPPCHRDFQCYVSNTGELDLMMAIRSWDLGLGAPFNIAQYALLTHLIARAAGLIPRKLIINYGDAHIYQNHLRPLQEAVSSRNLYAPTAQLQILTDNVDIDGYSIDDFDVTDYLSNGFIKLPIAV
jgi:thymidylate synthase